LIQKRRHLVVSTASEIIRVDIPARERGRGRNCFGRRGGRTIKTHSSTATDVEGQSGRLKLLTEVLVAKRSKSSLTQIPSSFDHPPDTPTIKTGGVTTLPEIISRVHPAVAMRRAVLLLSVSPPVYPTLTQTDRFYLRRAVADVYKKLRVYSFDILHGPS
jgi:hypothetical protein